MSPRLPQNAADRARRAPERAPRSAGVWPIRQSRQNDIASRFQRESRPPTKSRPTRFTCSRTGPKCRSLVLASALVFLDGLCVKTELSVPIRLAGIGDEAVVGVDLHVAPTRQLGFILHPLDM